MVRVLYGLMAVAGIVVMVANKQFVTSSENASRNVFGRNLREGSREHAFNARFSRVMALVVGAALTVMGVLGVFGISWEK